MVGVGLSGRMGKMINDALTYESEYAETALGLGEDVARECQAYSQTTVGRQLEAFRRCCRNGGLKGMRGRAVRELVGPEVVSP